MRLEAATQRGCPDYRAGCLDYRRQQAMLLLGLDALDLTYNVQVGRVANVLQYRHDEPRFEVAEQGASGISTVEVRSKRRSCPQTLLHPLLAQEACDRGVVL